MHKGIAVKDLSVVMVGMAVGKWPIVVIILGELDVTLRLGLIPNVSTIEKKVIIVEDDVVSYLVGLVKTDQKKGHYTGDELKWRDKIIHDLMVDAGWIQDIPPKSNTTTPKDE